MSGYDPLQTPSPRTSSSGETDEDTGETPDTTWEPDSDEEDVIETMVDRIAHPLWLIARALARLANVPFSELEREDEDGSEFSGDPVETSE